jgi:hypothetical protein
MALIMHNSSPKLLFEFFNNSEVLASHIACTAHVRNPLTQTHIFYIMILQIMHSKPIFGISLREFQYKDVGNLREIANRQWEPKD